MINGESGTGKELVARVLHDYSKRRNGPFVAINMAAIPRELIESELFGQKGRIHRAQARTEGRFQQAEGGTLFLDEIGDMPMEAQTRLLRVLQEGEYTTVGGRTPIKTERAHHRGHAPRVEDTDPAGVFREDLYYRLNVVPLRLPPLRERLEDVGDLVRHFLRQAAKAGLGHKSIETAAIDRLKALSLAGQRARAREPGSPPRGSQSRRHSDARNGGSGTGRGSTSAGRRTPPRARRTSPRWWSGIFRRTLRVTGASCPRRASTTGAATRRASAPHGSACGHPRQPDPRAASLLGLNRNTLRKKIRDLDIQVSGPRRSSPKGRARGSSVFPSPRMRKGR